MSQQCDISPTRHITRKRSGIIKMQQIGLKLRVELISFKRYNVFIKEEDERHESPSDTAADSFILFLFA